METETYLQDSPLTGSVGKLLHLTGIKFWIAYETLLVASIYFLFMRPNWLKAYMTWQYTLPLVAGMFAVFYVYGYMTRQKDVKHNVSDLSLHPSPLILRARKNV